MSNQQLIIMVGNIGCGKSLIAKKLAKMGALVVNMDSLVTMYHGGEYGMYEKDLGPQYRALESSAISNALDTGKTVVIDRTNMTRSIRERYTDLAGDIPTAVYDFGPGTLEGLARRVANPRGHTKQRWEKVFSDMAHSYEKPEKDEGFESILEFKDFKPYFAAFDFDGTIVENQFPEIGEIRAEVVDYMRDLYHSALSHFIIIWTARQGQELMAAYRFLMDAGIPFDFINENPLYDSGQRKVFAHEYWDDRAMAAHAETIAAVRDLRAGKSPE